MFSEDYPENWVYNKINERVSNKVKTLKKTYNFFNICLGVQRLKFFKEKSRFENGRRETPNEF